MKKYGWIYNPSRGFWKLSESFDEENDAIDGKQIAQNVNQQSFKNLEREDMTNLESQEAFERFVIEGLKDYTLKCKKKLQIFNTHLSEQFKREMAAWYINERLVKTVVKIWDYEDMIHYLGSLNAHAEYLFNPKVMQGCLFGEN